MIVNYDRKIFIVQATGVEDKKKNSQLLTDKEKRKKISTYEKLLEAVEAFGLTDLGAH